MDIIQLKKLIEEIEELGLATKIAIEARNADGVLELVRQEHVSIVVGGDPQVKLCIDPSWKERQ